MRTKSTILAYLVLLVLIPCHVVAESVHREFIESIEIDGNKRSKESYILRVVDIAPGDPWYPGLEEEIRDDLLDEFVFQQDSLTVETVDGEAGKIIRIHVEDRWTLIPIPLVLVSESSWSAGLFITESNFLGHGIMASVGFIYGSDTIYVGLFSVYNQHRLYGGYRLDDKEEITVSSGNVEVLRTYELNNPIAGISPGLELGDWQFNWDLAYIGAIIDDETTAGGTADPVGGHYFATGPSIKYSDATHVSVFSEGLTARLRLQYMTPAYISATGSLSLGHMAWKIFLSSDFRFGWGQLPDVSLFELGGGRTGSRTLPEGIAADAYANGTAKISAVIIPMGSVKLTGYGFYELGTFRDLRGEEVLHHGPGLGLALHLDKVALPAMDIGFSWNIPMADYTISFGLGMSF